MCLSLSSHPPHSHHLLLLSFLLIVFTGRREVQWDHWGSFKQILFMPWKWNWFVSTVISLYVYILRTVIPSTIPYSPRFSSTLPIFLSYFFCFFLFFPLYFRVHRVRSCNVHTNTNKHMHKKSLSSLPSCFYVYVFSHDFLIRKRCRQQESDHDKATYGGKKVVGEEEE